MTEPKDAKKIEEPLKIVLTFVEAEGISACKVLMESNDKDLDRDFMELKINDQSPAEVAASVAIKAVTKLQELIEMQVDLESVFYKDPGFVVLPTEVKGTYH